MKFNLITLFPNLITPHLEQLPFKKAIENEIANYNIVDLRKYGLGNYKQVDDKPYGGGKGMILMVEPIYNALKDTKSDVSDEIILLSPKGKKFTQKTAKGFANKKQITLISGRYEDVDSRVSENLVTKVISIGDYVLSGGELPSLVIMEAITRLLPGVLDKEATQNESFTNNINHKYPQYTKPSDFKGMKVPDVLKSGDHKKIETWKNKNTS